MADPNAALATQIRNIEAKTGQSLAQLTALVEASGLGKHGEIRSLLIERFGLGYGDANTVAALARQAAAPAPAAAADPLDDLYTGAKAGLRPVHEALNKVIDAFGPYEVAPKKGYLSLRRKKQFATIGPATKDRVEIGLNVKDLPADPRLTVEPPGGMCKVKLRIGSAAEVDAALAGWLRAAYDAAG